MTWDDALDAFASGNEDAALAALRWLLDEWDEHAARCRLLLASYLLGADVSERTERALFYVLHALGDTADTASHTDICRLAADAERVNLILGDDFMGTTLPCILVSTFDGDPAALQRLVDGTADDKLAGDSLLALAYLARTRALPDGWFARYAAAVLGRAEADGRTFFAFAWVKAVAAVGLAGFAPQAERIFRAGHVDPDLYESKLFWQDLRTAMADPDDMSDYAWTMVGPLGDAVEEISAMGDDDGVQPLAPETPALKPLHDVGRNDPCPCGSGKKFKKCCGVA